MRGADPHSLWEVSDPYADAVAVGLRDALLCGMTAVEPATGDWRDDWHPRSRRAAFIGVVEERDGDAAGLVVLFRVGPRWDVVYGWRVVLWSGGVQRGEVIAAHPDSDELVGSLALDLMEGIDGGTWELPEPEVAHRVWRPSSPRAVTWVRVPA